MKPSHSTISFDYNSFRFRTCESVLFKKSMYCRSVCPLSSLSLSMISAALFKLFSSLNRFLLPTETSALDLMWLNKYARRRNAILIDRSMPTDGWFQWCKPRNRCSFSKAVTEEGKCLGMFCIVGVLRKTSFTFLKLEVDVDDSILSLETSFILLKYDPLVARYFPLHTAL